MRSQLILATSLFLSFSLTLTHYLSLHHSLSAQLEVKKIKRKNGKKFFIVRFEKLGGDFYHIQRPPFQKKIYQHGELLFVLILETARVLFLPAIILHLERILWSRSWWCSPLLFGCCCCCRSRSCCCCSILLLKEKFSCCCYRSMSAVAAACVYC